MIDENNAHSRFFVICLDFVKRFIRGAVHRDPGDFPSGKQGDVSPVCSAGSTVQAVDKTKRLRAPCR